MITTNEYMMAERELELRDLKTGWLIHAGIYAVVITGLVILNLVIAANTENDFLWFFFPLVCWGIGLVFHYLHAFRWADRDVHARQEQVTRYAESHR